MVKRRRCRPRLKMTGDGKGLAAHVGTRLLADIADTFGLTEGLSSAMAPTKQRLRGHDRGEVLCDVAVAIADGAERISDLAVLRDQPEIFGEVASHATVWRTLEAVDGEALERIKHANAQARQQAWDAGLDPGFYVIDIDATLINVASDKQQAAPTYKKGYGFHPLLAFLDGSDEALAGLLRPGNASSSSGTDHVTVLDDALAALPVTPETTQLIVRTDSAGWSHEFVDACRERNVNIMTGHALTAPITQAILQIPENQWEPAITADGNDLREHAHIVEITDHVQHIFNTSRPWPTGLRMIARREQAHPGAQLTFTDINGHRYQVFITDLPDTDIAYLEALYRRRARVERQICDLKATGLNHFPSHKFTINQTWLHLALTAHNLLAWTRHLTLNHPNNPDNTLTKAEPKRLRYCLLHTPGRITRTSRTTHCHLPTNWPWTQHLTNAYTQLQHLKTRT